MSEEKKKDEPKVIKVTSEKETPIIGNSDSNKKNFEESREDVSPHYDPNQFGYKPKERVPFTGNLILTLMGILNAVRIKESNIVYTPNDSFEKTVESGTEQITEIGLQCIRAMEMINQDHMQNIDEGYATHQDILMKEVPKK